MIYLVDGSNLLGTAGADREAVEDKRALLRAVASFARRRNAKLVLFFDGAKPEGFASSLGAVQAQFSGPRPADDLIAARARETVAREPVCVVTSDAALAARVSARTVDVIRCAEFLPLLETPSATGPPEGDWEAYFSDPKNREEF